MADDKRSPGRVGKPLVYGEIIISESIYLQNLAAAREEGRAAGYAEAIEKAAKVAESRGGMPYYGRGRPGTPPAYSSAIATAYVDTGEADPPRRTYSYPKTGIVFCGWRHCDCFVPLTAWAQRLSLEERARVGEEQIAGLHQGFLTSRGRYVDRQEGMTIARRAGQTTADKTDLFSEDLY